MAMLIQAGTVIGGIVLRRGPQIPDPIRLLRLGRCSRNRPKTSSGGAQSRPIMRSLGDKAGDVLSSQRGNVLAEQVSGASRPGVRSILGRSSTLGKAQVNPAAEWPADLRREGVVLE